MNCFVLTQTLGLIADVHAAVRHTHHILREGTLLATMATTCQIGDKQPHLVEYWCFTPSSCKALFGNVFGVTSVAKLVGMAQEELKTRELAYADSAYAVLVAVQAVKS